MQISPPPATIALVADDDEAVFDRNDVVDRTLSGGFVWLRFPAALEARFVEDRAAARLELFF